MASETQRPDGSRFDLSNLTGAYTDVDDDPDSPDGLWLAGGDDGTDTICTASFPTPTGNPTTGAGLQEFRVLCRKFITGGTDPTLDIAVYENGTLVSTISTGTSITSESGQVVAATWDATILGTADGSLVEIRVTGQRSGGSPGDRRSVEFGALEWNVTYDAGGGPALFPPFRRPRSRHVRM